MSTASNREIIIGIDLGTTNSEVAIVADGRPRIIPGSDDEPRGVVPSVVGLDAEGRLLVGEPARNQMLHAPERTVRSIKRLMGSEDKVRLGEVEYSPQEISALILRHLADRAQKHLGEEVRRAVITVPAYFNDAQRQATREAGELAGLEVVRLIHEPTAASLVYEADHFEDRDGEDRQKRLLVYDLGGGTFDVSIVEIHRDVVEVRASHGDTRLGGDDFDQKLLEHVAARFSKEHGVDLLSLPRSRMRLLRAVEAAKRELSTKPFAQLEEEFIAEKGEQPLHLAMELSREEYEHLIRPLVERSMESVQTALHDAGWLARDLDGIILVGGSTRTPLIQEELKHRTGLEPRFDVDPDLCVAMGAASQAGLIAGEDVHSVLVDITPHSFGIRCLNISSGELDTNHFSRVITKGTPLPATRSKAYFTCIDDQEAVSIEIFQGENPNVDQNAKLGNFLIQDLEPGPAGSPIVVDFQLTLDGILKVEAMEKVTAKKSQIVIDDALHSFTPEDRERALQRLDRLRGDGLFRVLADASEQDPASEAKAIPAGASSVEPAARGTATPSLTDTETSPSGVPASDHAITEREEILETIRKVRQRLAEMVLEDREEAIQWIEQATRHIDAGQFERAREAHRELEEILFFVEEG